MQVGDRIRLKQDILSMFKKGNLATVVELEENGKRYNVQFDNNSEITTLQLSLYEHFFEIVSFDLNNSLPEVRY